MGRRGRSRVVNVFFRVVKVSDRAAMLLTAAAIETPNHQAGHPSLGMRYHARRFAQSKVSY